MEEARELSSWNQMRKSARRYLRRLKDDSEEWLSSMKLWRGDIHLIEGERRNLKKSLHFTFSHFNPLSPCHSTGMFGTGILSYFSFLRFLVVLNLIIFLLMFSFVMLPIIVAPHASGNITYNPDDGLWGCSHGSAQLGSFRSWSSCFPGSLQGASAACI